MDNPSEYANWESQHVSNRLERILRDVFAWKIGSKWHRLAMYRNNATHFHDDFRECNRFLGGC